MKPIVPLVAAALWLGLMALGGCHEVPKVAEVMAAASLVFAILSTAFLLLEVLDALGVVKP